MNEAKKWRVETKSAAVLVWAADQWGAFDALRDVELHDFGIVAQATPYRDDGTLDEGAAFAIRTTALMGRWNRPTDFLLANAAAVRLGLPDTRAIDWPGASQ